MRHDALHRNVERLHGFEPLEVEGELPSDLRGLLVRTGPGLPERFGRRVPHVFLSDGLLSAVRFFDGRAAGATRAVETDAYLEEEAAGRRLYGPGAPWGQRLRRLLGGARAKNTGNTSVYPMAERLYAQVESSRPLEVDPDTLATLGERDLGRTLGPSFSAHPHYVPALRTSFNFGVRWGRVTFLDVYAVPDEGSPRKLTEIELPWGSFVHDFAVTETHLVFLVPPTKVRPLHARLGIGGFSDWFAWRPELGTRALVVPLDEPGRVRHVELPPFWFFHVGATARRDGRLEIDVVASPDDTVVRTLGTGAKAPPALYTRIGLPLERGEASMTALWDQGCEFPRVDPRREGSGPRQCWVAARGRGVARLDLEDGARDVWDPVEDVAASEPVMVPAGEAEGEGWVLCLAHFEPRNESAVLVFDAQHIARGPVARVWWGQTIPTTYHGCFVAAS